MVVIGTGAKGEVRGVHGHSVRTCPEASSHTTCQGTFSHSGLSSLWTDPGIKSGISVRELISTLKKKKKKSAGGE